jgi:glycosyltransferase involved in cell wall biosynthesis
VTVVQLTSSRFFGSVERQMLGLAACLPANCQSAFVSFSEGNKCADFLRIAKLQGYRAIALAHDTPRLLSALRELIALLRDLKADILCCRGYKANLLGGMAGRRVGIPVIAVSHGWTGENLKVRAYEAMERFGLRRMDRVVCVSQAQAGKVQKRGVARNRLLVIPDAVQTERFSHPKACFREALGNFFPKSAACIIGAAGRLSPEKGFEVLIDAAAIVLDRDPSASFVLFGEGPLRESLSRQILARGLKHTFILAGFRRDLDDFLPHLDLMVLPSFTEGLPNVVLEAFAAGVPVVATEVGGTPEVVKHGVNGLLVRPGDAQALARAICQLLASEQRRREMGQRGRKLVEAQFTFEAQRRWYLQLFRSLARPGRVPSHPGSPIQREGSSLGLGLRR